MFAGAFMQFYYPELLQKVLVLVYTLNIPFTIEAWSIQKVFLMDAVTYFIGIIYFLLIKYTPIVKDEIHLGSYFLD